MRTRGLLIWVVVISLLYGGLVSAAGGSRKASSPPRGIWSSLAWSPDGKTIAFVVTERPVSYEEGMYQKTTEASIWLMPVSGGIRRARLLHTFHAGNRGTGIPTALFWLSDGRIAWAATDDRGLGVYFTASGTWRFDPKSIGVVHVALDQSLACPDVEGADDVYYDPRSRELLLTGKAGWYAGEGTASSLVVCSYSLVSGKLTIMALPVGATEGGEACVRRGSIYDVCYHDESAGRLLLTEFEKRGGRWVSRQLDSVSDHAEGPFYVPQSPRPSPDGRLLAWIRMTPKEGGVPHLDFVLCDSVSGGRRTIARSWRSFIGTESPVRGCSFCWSPKGDRIAYADGASIKFVKVPPSLPAGHAKSVSGRSKR